MQQRTGAATKPRRRKQGASKRQQQQQLWRIACACALLQRVRAAERRKRERKAERHARGERGREDEAGRAEAGAPLNGLADGRQRHAEVESSRSFDDNVTANVPNTYRAADTAGAPRGQKRVLLEDGGATGRKMQKKPVGFYDHIANRRGHRKQRRVEDGGQPRKIRKIHMIAAGRQVIRRQVQQNRQNR